MRLKTVATAALLLLVSASIVAPVVRRWTVADRRADDATASRPDRLVLYCFHGKIRCRTCDRIEAFAREAAEQGFAGQLAEGSIEWRAVDYQRPGNEHFIDEYQLVASSVVLVRIRGGVPRQWKNLVDIWQYVEDRNAAVRYVQDEVRSAMSGLDGDR